MSEPQKGIKIVFGPVHPVVEKEEIIKVPSEKAGEKRIIKHIDLDKELEDFLELQATSYQIKRDKDGNIVSRTSENGTVLTGKDKEAEEER